MPTKKTMTQPRPTDAESVVASLKRLANKKTRDGMARYGIPSDNAFGVPVGKIRELGKKLGRNHELAAAMWKTNIYEARMLTAFIADPKQVTPAQMDRWCRDFDSWAICDTLCFHLFDRTPHAWAKVVKWSDKSEEFVKRAAFALLASLALHDKSADDDLFLETLPLIERSASDPRNFVKKGVSWALRAIGERSSALNAAAIELASALAESEDGTRRWIGKDALRSLGRESVRSRLARRGK